MKTSLRFKKIVFSPRWRGPAVRLVLTAALVVPTPSIFGLAVLDGVHGPTAGVSVTTGAEANLKSISYEGKTLRIRLDREVPYRVFTLTRPARLVVELPKTVHGPKPYEASVNDDVLKRIRSAQFKAAPDFVTRIVLDLPRMVAYHAARDGNSIVVRFDGESAVLEPSPTNASMGEPTIVGQAEAQVVAAAAERGGGSTASRAKDLLATLPKNAITIDFDEADIRDVVRVLAEMSGINMIYANDLRGNVTIHLDRVPFDEVFSTILTTQGLVAQQIGNNILRILTPEALTTDRARSVTTYKTFILSYGKAAEISTHLSAVKISPTARFTIDDRNNAIIVTDTPEGLAAAERLILELDRKPPQVLIETKIVQIDLNKSLDIGIQWEYSNIKFGDNPLGEQKLLGSPRYVEGTAPPDGVLGFRSQNSTGGDIVAFPGAPGNQRGTGVNLPGPRSTGISFGFLNSDEMLTATLSALETNRQGKTLTNPKIVTTNNQPAKIQIGQKVPFLQTTVSGTGTATQSTVFADVGFIIDVTPTISIDNRIRLKVKPESSEVVGTSDAGPTINTTTAETEVLLQDGETIVIGGLVSERMIESANKVPILGDLPVLGVFFRNSSNTKTRQELLVFITARIVPD